MTAADTAVELFQGGCACSQAVLSAFAARFGLDPGEARRVATCFSGGMRRAETCGAVTGALMVIGLTVTAEACRTADGRGPAYTAAAAFTDAFRQAHGTLECRTLLGCDISTPAGKRFADEQHLFKTRCPVFVRMAAEWLETSLPRG
jgi:C_GCAxxG_C_C family probable redox protein